MRPSTSETFRRPRQAQLFCGGCLRHCPVPAGLWLWNLCRIRRYPYGSKRHGRTRSAEVAWKTTRYSMHSYLRNDFVDTRNDFSNNNASMIISVVGMGETSSCPSVRIGGTYLYREAVYNQKVGLSMGIGNCFCYDATFLSWRHRSHGLTLTRSISCRQPFHEFSFNCHVSCFHHGVVLYVANSYCMGIDLELETPI
jgi:hypothetical protein